jgi:anti-anti-sigma factor
VIRIPSWLEDAPAQPSGTPVATGAAQCTLSVSRRACEVVVVVTVHGQLDIDGSATLDHRLQQILAAGDLSRLVVDLSRVSGLDDYGVRALLRAGDAARTSGTQLRVVIGDGAAWESLDERGVRPLLPTAPDVDSACAEVFAPTGVHPRDVA